MEIKKTNIALVGFGNIGSYFYKVLEKNINSMLVPPEPSNINSDYNNIIINNSISKIIQKESDNLNDNDNNIHYKIKKISNEMNELLSENSDDEHCDNNISDSD